MNYDAFEAATSDSPGDPRWPLYTQAPTDAEAAAPGDPFVHLITLRSDPKKILVRFWFPTERYEEELRIDAEPLVDHYDGTPASLSATPR